jgi:uncharacterized protein (TIGR02246 family)
MQATPSDEEAIRALYREIIAAWNRRSSADYARPFAVDANMIGFDGSQINGREAITAEIGRIFQDHLTAAYVTIIKEVRFLDPQTAILRAIAGLVPPGKNDLNPAINAVQSLVAHKGPLDWQIALFQNTPAQFHGRPELVEQMTAELRALL